MMSSFIERLPTELLFQIGHMCAEIRPTARHPTRTKLSYLSNLARTSWHMYHALKFRLYEKHLTEDDIGSNLQSSCILWAVKENRLETLKTGVLCYLSIYPTRMGLKEAFNKETWHCSRSYIPEKPLHYAIKHDNPEMMKIILDNGAELDAIIPTCRCSDVRYYHYALHTAIAHSLVKETADVLIKDRGACWVGPHLPAIPALLKAGRTDLVEYLKDLPSASSSCLSFAVDDMDADLVRKMLRRVEVDVNVCNVSGLTTVARSIKNGSIEILNMLLDDSRVMIPMKIRDGRLEIPLLHWATLFGHQNVVERLLKHPEINAALRDAEQRTALHYAAMSPVPDRTGVLVALMNHSAFNVSDEDIHGHTMLHFLSKHDDWENHADFVFLVKAFMECGGSIDKISTNGTAFHEALHCGLGDYRSAARLLDLGADPSISHECEHGCAPLHLCLMHEAKMGQKKLQTDLVETLITRGANVNALRRWVKRDVFGKRSVILGAERIRKCTNTAIAGTPLFFAAAMAQNEDCVELLLDYGASPHAEMEANFHYMDPPEYLLTAILRSWTGAGRTTREEVHSEILQLLLDARASLQGHRVSVLLPDFEVEDESDGYDEPETPLRFCCRLSNRGSPWYLMQLLAKATSLNVSRSAVQELIGLYSKRESDEERSTSSLLTEFYNAKLCMEDDTTTVQ